MSRVPLPPLRDVLAGRHLVVTGATGFVGKVWLCHLLCHLPEVGKVTVLVRGGRQASARERLARLVDTSPAFRPLRERHGDDLGAFLDARVEVLDADLTRPGCGLSPAEVARLAGTADVLVHIAGDTDFQPDPRRSFPVNVDGTRHVADLAARFRVPRVLHVSTCYVAGVADGEVPEALTPGVSPLGIPFDVDAELARVAELLALPEASARVDAAAARAAELGWPNLYTYSKGLAEHLLASRDLELAIVRPSVVECARTFPFPAWNEGLNTSGPIMWFCGTAFPALPARAAHRFDVIPVDAVVRWTTVVLARLLRGEHARVYQLASSDVNPATFGRIVELTALGKRRHASRPTATALERLVAQLDVAPRPIDDLPLLTPERLEGWGRELVDHLGAVNVAGRLPRLLRGLGRRADNRVRDARKRVQRATRTLGRLRRMLEQYRPFLHDHDWCFHTGNIRAEVAALHPSDRPAFGDDLSTLCWRGYWLDVQYEGMVRWAFPLLEGREAPLDPPSDPPLSLGAHPHPWDVQLATQGVA